MKVKLNFDLIFDPSEAWSSTTEFEMWLANSLKQVGLGAERIKKSIDEDENCSMFLIVKLPEGVERDA